MESSPPDQSPSATDALQKARELMEKYNQATFGEWTPVVPEPEGTQCKDFVARFPYDRHQKEKYHVLIRSSRCQDHAIGDFSTNHTCVELLQQEDNARFVCELHNAFPSIHAELEKVTVERDVALKGYREMREALKFYKKLDDEMLRFNRGLLAKKDMEDIDGVAHKALTSFPEIK